VVDAGLAFKHGFYLETGWILSLLFEKKAKNLLRRIENEPRSAGYSFEQSIRRMKYLYRAGCVPQLNEFLDKGLIDEMWHWKKTRNSMLKDMMTSRVSQPRMERVASEAISLYKKWNRGLKIVRDALKNTANPTLQQMAEAK